VAGRRPKSPTASSYSTNQALARCLGKESARFGRPSVRQTHNAQPSEAGQNLDPAWSGSSAGRTGGRRCDRRQGGAGPRAPWGGDGAAGALPLTRLAACPWGILWPGFSTSMPGSKARSKGFFYVLSREHQLAGPRGARGTPPPFLPAGRSSAWARCPGPMPGLRWSQLRGLARCLAGRRNSSSRKRRRLHGKPRQATGETELWRAPSRRGKMAG
jgi:hypothetical protein